MNPLIRLAANALPGEKTYVLFAGAGVSKDAGIPTSWDLMIETAKYFYLEAHQDTKVEDVKTHDIEEWFTGSKYAEMEYADVIGGIYSSSVGQQQFLKEFLGEREPGEAHRAIAEMARRGILRAIVTTNFDHCLEHALKEKGLDVQVIASDEVLEYSEPIIHCKKVRVYKPHGTLGEGLLRNTPKDLENLSPVMEEELISLLSEHGVIIIGYSGQDPGILKVLSARRSTYYPLFWVNPSQPKAAAALFDTDCAVYIPCEGAGKFLNDLLTFQDRIRALAPSGTAGDPSIAGLEAALSGSEPAAPLYQDFLKGIYHDLEGIKPDFSRFDNYDEAIFNQIQIGEDISYRFIEAALLAARYENTEVLKSIYNFFGEFLKLYDIPRGYSGDFRTTDFDGNKFLIHEMFLGFVASLMHSDRWDCFVELLPYELFTEDYRGELYRKYTSIYEYVESFDKSRRDRLGLNRISLSADFLKDRFTNGKLSGLLNFREIMDADFFLFQYAVYNIAELDGGYLDDWYPKTTIYLDGPPSYLKRAESCAFLPKVAEAFGFADPREFVSGLPKCKHYFDQIDNSRYPFANPLNNIDLDKFGSKM